MNADKILVPALGMRLVRDGRVIQRNSEVDFSIAGAICLDDGPTDALLLLHRCCSTTAVIGEGKELLPSCARKRELRDLLCCKYSTARRLDISALECQAQLPGFRRQLVLHVPEHFLAILASRREPHVVSLDQRRQHQTQLRHGEPLTDAAGASCLYA